MAIYYTDINDNNRNDGTSFDTAFKTLTRGVAALSPGDTLKVGAGTYTGEALVINTPGVTVEAYGNGAVIVDGGYEYPGGAIKETGIVLPDGTVTTGYTNSALIDINADGVTLRGVMGRNSRGRGLRVYDCNDATVEDCAIDGARSHALIVWNANNVTVRGSEFAYGCNFAMAWRKPSVAKFPKGAIFSRCSGGLMEDCRLHHFYGAAMGTLLCSDVVVRGCTIHDSWRTGVNLTSSTDVVVEDCHIYLEDPDWLGRAFGGLIFYPEKDLPGGTNTRCIFRRNLVVDYDGACSVLVEAGVENIDCKMINNTFISRRSGENIVNLRKPHATLTMERNIFCASDGVAATINNDFIGSAPTFRDNLWHGYEPADAIRGTGYINADPLFVDENGAASNRDNFRLRAGSPAIDGTQYRGALAPVVVEPEPAIDRVALEAWMVEGADWLERGRALLR